MTDYFRSSSPVLFLPLLYFFRSSYFNFISFIIFNQKDFPRLQPARSPSLTTSKISCANKISYANKFYKLSFSFFLVFFLRILFINFFLLEL